MSKQRKNGPVRTYKFVSEDLMKQFDKGKIAFSEAVVPVKGDKMIFITQAWLKQHTTNVKHYIYANYLDAECSEFMIVNETTGEVWFHRYMLLRELYDRVSDSYWTVYLTNIH